jgi:type I restriction enzyme M protein
MISSGRGGSEAEGEGAKLGRGSQYRGGYDFSGLKMRARELRKKQTDAEALLWDLLRDRQLCDSKFRRQHQFGDYICDFYCHEANLVVECDGEVHESPDQKKHDQTRDAYLKSQGLTVIRFQNNRVLNDTPAILEEIASHLPSPADSQLPSPSGRGAGGEGEVARISGDLLTPDERGRLAKNFKGYDISPDMVRLSLVNLYLHGFADPHIVEYDTLTSEERWNEYADVILANPPFMSPKGGIKPHKRFSIQAKRSEVLFVDYMAEHLTPTGRAAIIVPEGIIFQSQTAYKQLRKSLLENSLVAVVSLPAGCFNPYSGVKTSILILDKSLAKQSDTIAFFKVENDGFGLGAQRRAVTGSDLPAAAAFLKDWFKGGANSPSEPLCESGDGSAGAQAVTPAKALPPAALIVPKEKIADNGDYNLSGERYREVDIVNQKWPMVELGTVARLINGRAYKREELLTEGPTPVLRVGNFFSNRGWYYSDLELGPDKYCEPGDLLFAWSASFGPRIWDGPRAIYHYHIWKVEPTDAINKMFLFHLLAADSDKIKAEGHGIAMVHATKGGMEKRKFPLPPLEVQKEIVTEIEGYQKVIDGARAVLDHYRPHIPIHPDWPVPTFEEAPFQIIDGDRGKNYPSKGDFTPSGHCLFLNTKNVRSDGFKFDELEFINETKDNALRKGKLERGDVLLTTRGTIGNTGFYDATVEFDHIRINSGMLIFRPDATQLSSSYLFLFFQSENFKVQREAIVSGAAQPQLPIRNLKEAKIPLPPLATQQAIVAEIEAEQALVAANRELITRFDQKIQTTLARIWGEEKA